jgi:hypothetical protein
MNTPLELYKRFQYQFDGKNIGIGIFKGWFPLFSKLCEDIDAALGDDKRGFHWIQCKEKFGAPRWYFSMKSDAPGGIAVSEQQPDGSLKTIHRSHSADNVLQSISTLIDDAQERAAGQCQVCGAPAKIGRHGMGLYATYCTEHSRMAVAGQDLPPHYWSVGDESGDWR